MPPAMGQTWAEIDARPKGELDPCDVVCGVPPLSRQLRQAGRLGWAGARVAVADDAQATRVADALRRDPPPAALAVEVAVVVDGAPTSGRPDAVRLDASAIYTRDVLAAATPGTTPTPAVELRAAADRARARAVLFAGIRKSLALDGLVSFYVIRPLTRPFVRLLVDTRVSPNAVTLTALLCGLSAAVCAAGGGAARTAAAGLLYWLGGAIDHMDGDLARLRLTSSKVGEWLDSMTDETSTYALCAGLGLGMMHDGRGAGWAALGVGAAIAGVVAMAPLYRELHRRGLPIDTAQFPWFFQSGAGDTAERVGLGKLVYYVGFLVRRDVNVTVVALLLVSGLRAAALIGLAAGAAIGLGLTVTHYGVTAVRRA
jgi:phosphatidylglycerophosphate synthase